MGFRKIAFIGLLSVLPLTASAAINIFQTKQKTSIQCNAGGTTTAQLTGSPNDRYLLTVLNETAWVCLGTACSTGGIPMAPGTQMEVVLKKGSVACRSSGGSGQLDLTAIESK